MFLSEVIQVKTVTALYLELHVPHSIMHASVCLSCVHVAMVEGSEEGEEEVGGVLVAALVAIDLEVTVQATRGYWICYVSNGYTVFVDEDIWSAAKAEWIERTKSAFFHSLILSSKELDV